MISAHLQSPGKLMSDDAQKDTTRKVSARDLAAIRKTASRVKSVGREPILPTAESLTAQEAASLHEETAPTDLAEATMPGSDELDVVEIQESLLEAIDSFDPADGLNAGFGDPKYREPTREVAPLTEVSTPPRTGDAGAGHDDAATQILSTEALSMGALERDAVPTEILEMNDELEAAFDEYYELMNSSAEEPAPMATAPTATAPMNAVVPLGDKETVAVPDAAVEAARDRAVQEEELEELAELAEQAAQVSTAAELAAPVFADKAGSLAVETEPEITENQGHKHRSFLPVVLTIVLLAAVAATLTMVMVGG